MVSREEKVAVTAAIANRDGRTILFARTRHGVDRLAKQLGRLGVRAGTLHGGKAQGARTRTLAQFREGEFGADRAWLDARGEGRFDGTQPKFRQSPPRRFLSTSATLAPRAAAPAAVTSPAVPAPRTTRL